MMKTFHIPDDFAPSITTKPTMSLKFINGKLYQKVIETKCGPGLLEVHEEQWKEIEGQ